MSSCKSHHHSVIQREMRSALFSLWKPALNGKWNHVLEKPELFQHSNHGNIKRQYFARAKTYIQEIGTLLVICFGRIVPTNIYDAMKCSFGVISCPNHPQLFESWCFPIPSRLSNCAWFSVFIYVFNNVNAVVHSQLADRLQAFKLRWGNVGYSLKYFHTWITYEGNATVTSWCEAACWKNKMHQEKNVLLFQLSPKFRSYPGMCLLHMESLAGQYRCSRTGCRRSSWTNRASGEVLLIQKSTVCHYSLFCGPVCFGWGELWGRFSWWLGLFHPVLTANIYVCLFV